ncbi:RNA-directed DNA polymerase, eukaryota, reverse transcriptase zinc-binding domain protein [Tanacetum coccineum]
MEVFTLIVDHKISNSFEFRYHAGCKDLKLTHLCFADDLLVLCHGDKGSVRIIKESLDDFSKVLGLVPNLNKSTIFFGNVNIRDQRSILSIVPFKNCSDMKDFIDCVDNIEVEDVCWTGLHFTWIKLPSNPNTGILKKLDRVMANEDFFSKFNHAYVVFHPFMVSDHSPIVLIMPNEIVKNKRPFKFANYVANKSDFLPTIENVWNEEVHGHQMFQLAKKLKSLKKHIRIGTMKKLAASTLKEYQEAMKDENSSKVVEEFVHHFDNFLGKSYQVDHVDSLWDIFTTTLNSDEANDMVREVSDIEIKDVMFGIGDCKAPGPDGYTA